MTDLLYKPELKEVMALIHMGEKRRDSFIVRHKEKRDFSAASRLRYASAITVHGYHYEQNFVGFLKNFRNSSSACINSGDKKFSA